MTMHIAPFNRPCPADWYLQRLRLPDARGESCVIDTDAANEIDDQFALAWALIPPRPIRTFCGLYATPFSFAHRRSHLSAELPTQMQPPFNTTRSRNGNAALMSCLRVQALLNPPTHAVQLLLR